MTTFRFDLAALKGIIQRSVSGGQTVPLRVRSKVTVSPEFVAAVLADEDSFWRNYVLKFNRGAAITNERNADKRHEIVS